MSQLCFGTFASAMQRALKEDPLWWNKNISVDATNTRTADAYALTVMQKHYLEKSGERNNMTNTNKKQLQIELDYTHLWKLLIDRQKKKEDLKRDAGISSASIARISKGENVNTETLLRICQYLECDIKDVCEVKQVKNN